MSTSIISPSRLRIDELAQRSGVASGTIRFWQREGLLAPPVREGRVAFYAESHRLRLERIRVLQAQGLPLAMIRDLLAREDAGQDISPWLALDSAVFAPFDTAEPIGDGELTRLGLNADGIAQLERAGILRRRGSSLSALPGMLELIARLLEDGVPPDTIRAGAELIGARLEETASAIVGLGWEIFASERQRLADGDPDAATAALARFEHLRALALRVVANAFPQLLDETIRARVERAAA